MAIDVHRREPQDDPPWIEVEHDGARYQFQIVAEDELQLTSTGETDQLDQDPPGSVIERLESMGYREVRS